jgi:hypothetical protein
MGWSVVLLYHVLPAVLGVKQRQALHQRGCVEGGVWRAEHRYGLQLIASRRELAYQVFCRVVYVSAQNNSHKKPQYEIVASRGTLGTTMPRIRRAIITTARTVGDGGHGTRAARTGRTLA